jgi:glycosyltransferase involved in cell wall biosynthesis
VIRGSDVTVVIPTIDGREELLNRALRSVETQQVRPAKIVVQLDRDRLGAAQTRNAALEHVTTEWVAWLDDDDEFLPNHVKVCVRAANAHRDAGLIFTYPEIIGGDDPLACISDDDRWIQSPIHVPFGPKQRNYLRWRGNFIPVTYLVKTQLVRDVGGFPLPYEFDSKVSGDCEDYGLLLKMLDAGAEFHHFCGVRTWRYYFHDSNLGGRGLDRMHELTGG